MNKLDLTDSQVIKLKKLLESLFDFSTKKGVVFRYRNKGRFYNSVDDFEPEIEEIYIKLAKIAKIKNET